MARRTPTPPAPPRPQFVRHVKRPEWGIGRVTDTFAGLRRVSFADGSTRDFRDDVLEVVPESDVPEALRNAPAPAPVAPPPAKPTKRAARKT